MYAAADHFIPFHSIFSGVFALTSTSLDLSNLYAQLMEINVKIRSVPPTTLSHGSSAASSVLIPTSILMASSSSTLSSPRISGISVPGDLGSGERTSGEIDNEDGTEEDPRQGEVLLKASDSSIL